MIALYVSSVIFAPSTTPNERNTYYASRRYEIGIKPYIVRTWCPICWTVRTDRMPPVHTTSSSSSSSTVQSTTNPHAHPLSAHRHGVVHGFGGGRGTRGDWALFPAIRNPGAPFCAPIHGESVILLCRGRSTAALSTEQVKTGGPSSGMRRSTSLESRSSTVLFFFPGRHRSFHPRSRHLSVSLLLFYFAHTICVSQHRRLQAASIGHRIDPEDQLESRAGRQLTAMSHNTSTLQSFDEWILIVQTGGSPIQFNPIQFNPIQHVAVAPRGVRPGMTATTTRRAKSDGTFAMPLWRLSYFPCFYMVPKRRRNLD